MSAVITFENVSKHYRLRHRRPRAFRDIFTGQWLRQFPGASAEILWAVRDASFSIQAGESVGFVGANGAGKSTILKLISQVIVPNVGRVTTRGRVAALLELGTGFHPELNGRDNIFLSGALAGMSRADIKRKFDSIVAFSELEEFIDMPVKHYSSGMFARLAFAVSIHLDPEILLVDEVLAVGDKNFQLKCLERLAEIKGQGVTVALVSHSEDTIQAQCARAIWLQHGRVCGDGSTESVLAAYHGWQKQQLHGQADYTEAAAADEKPARITQIRLVNEQGEENSVFETGQCFRVQISYRAQRRIADPIFGMAIYTPEGVWVTGPNTGGSGLDIPFIEGEGHISFTIPHLPLLDGVYLVSISLHDRALSVMYDLIDRQINFRVLNQSARLREKYGLITVHGQWALS